MQRCSAHLTPCSKVTPIYSRSDVPDKRESKSRPNVGIVTVKTSGFNQDRTVVIQYKRTFMIYYEVTFADPRPTPAAMEMYHR